MFIDGDTFNPSETLTTDQLTSFLLSCSRSFSSSSLRAVTFPPSIHFRTRLALPSAGRPSPCRPFIAVTVTVPTINITQKPRKALNLKGAAVPSQGRSEDTVASITFLLMGRVEGKRVGVFFVEEKSAKVGETLHSSPCKVLPSLSLHKKGGMKYQNKRQNNATYM